MRVVRTVPGLVAFGAFFLPWIEGSGPLAGVTFSGYDLVGYTGALRQLESMSGGELWVAQVGVLLTIVAATWLMILAAAGAWPLLRHVCAGYLVVIGGAFVAVGMVEGSAQAGAILTLVAGLLLLAMELVGPLSRRVRAGREGQSRRVRDEPAAASAR